MTKTVTDEVSMAIEEKNTYSPARISSLFEPRMWNNLIILNTLGRLFKRMIEIVRMIYSGLIMEILVATHPMAAVRVKHPNTGQARAEKLPDSLCS